jgi:hypothetical protein
MTATLNLDATGTNTMMIVKFPDYTLRFAVSLAGNTLNEVISYEDGVIGILVGPDNEEDYIDLNYVCDWVGYKPRVSNILLEI